ncbi:hypothetical protein [Streptomyces oceani]|nr:hypothetical protein [Streptomyces oceani]
MRSEIESMRGFKARVDALLEELTGSDADSGRLGQEGMAATTLGGEFLEASVLHQGYDQVIQQLTRLSRMLSGQVDGLGTAVRAASNGYEGVDEDARRRMWAIQKRAESRYDAKLDPYAVRNEDGSYDTGGGKPQGTGEGGY